jgi:hypothetical protein
LVSAILLLSAREWILLLTGRKPAVLRESEPVWLPDYAVVEAASGPRLGAAGAAALALALSKELSVEAAFERAQEQSPPCSCACASDRPARLREPARDARAAQRLYVAVTEERFHGVRRCC